MLVYRLRQDGSICDDRIGNHVDLSHIRNQIVADQEVQVFDDRTNDDVTQAILFKVITSDPSNVRDTRSVNRALQELIRENARSALARSSGVHSPTFNENTLSGWIRHMRDYGTSWYRNFGKQFFRSEYERFIVNALMYFWQNRRIDIDAASSLMGNRSRKTVLIRLRDLTREGWITRESPNFDRRRTILAPTESLVTLARVHFARTLVSAIDAIKTTHNFNTSIASIIDSLLEENDGRIDNALLLPWVEYLNQSADDWTGHFGARFPPLEYNEIFSRVVMATEGDDSLTYGDLSSLPSGAPMRSRVTLIRNAISDNLILRSNAGNDQRVSKFTATSKLQRLVRSYHSYGLERFVALVERLPAEQSERTAF